MSNDILVKLSSIEWIVFGVVVLFIMGTTYYLIKSRKRRKPQKVDDPEDPLTSVLRHLDDI